MATLNEQQALDCAMEGDFEGLIELLDEGVGLETRDDVNQFTLLHWSALGNHVQMMKGLIDRGSNVEAKGQGATTPLFLSSLQGHLDATQLLLDRGANISAKAPQDYSPLHAASQNGHAAVVSLLLDRGADIDALNILQSTPLLIACASGCMEVITVLLDRGANLDAVNVNRWSCLHAAAYCDQLDVCLYLIDVKGFDPAMLDSKGDSALSHYGSFVGPAHAIAGDDRPALTPSERQVRVSQLVAARENYLQRIRDENWAKNWALIKVVVEHGFRPSAAQVAALLVAQVALDPAAPIAPLSRDSPEENRLYLQHAILGNDGLLRHIVSFIPVPRELAELSLPLSQRHLTRKKKAV